MASAFITGFRPWAQGTLRGYFSLQYGSLAVRDCAWHVAGSREWIEPPHGIEFDPLVADDAAVLAALHDFLDMAGTRRAKIKRRPDTRQGRLL